MNQLELAKAVSMAIAKQAAEIDLNRDTEMLVEFTLSGSAVVRKGINSIAVVDAAVPYEKLLAVALSKLNGVTLESIVREAVETEVLTSEVKKQAQKAVTKFKGQSKRLVSGRTTVKAQKLDVMICNICENC